MTTKFSAVETPSVEAVLSQAEVLLDSLSTFSPPRYPSQTARIAAVLEMIARRIRKRLWEIYQDPKADSSRPSLVYALSEAVHTIFSYLRYLQASDPISSPPGVQSAITNLVDHHLPKLLCCDKDEIVTLVRPQWTYNLKFVDLLSSLEDVIEVGLLDPDGELGVSDIRSFIATLWEIEKPIDDRTKPPKHVAVLSFAGLDRDNVLFYPILAHEIGHFIDFSYAGTIHACERVIPNGWLPSVTDVQALVDQFHPVPQNDVLRLKIVESFKDQLCDRIQICLRELAADLLGTRMLGLSFFFSMAEFLRSLFPWPQPMVDASGYPGIAFRLHAAWTELMEPTPAMNASEQLRVLGPTNPGLAYIEEWKRRFDALDWRSEEPEDLPSAFERLVEDRVRDALPRLQSMIRELVSPDPITPFAPELQSMIELLRLRIPPFQPPLNLESVANGRQPIRFSDVLTTGWFYQIGLGKDVERTKEKPEDRHAEYRDTCALILKAIDLSPAKDVISRLEEPDPTRASRSHLMAMRESGVASGSFLIDALTRDLRNENHRLFVVPYYGVQPIEAASWDLHLGSWFRIARRTSYTSINLANAGDRKKVRREGQEETYVPLEAYFVLHPGDFALGISLEYLSLPKDLMAYVEGKSSLGRAGLIIATATQVAPGFRGCIVLELANTGTVPLMLTPGMRIAQLVFQRIDRDLSSDWLYTGPFRCQVKP